MERRTPHDYATTNVLAWTATQSANVEPSVEEDAPADTDEPPDCRQSMSPVSTHFQRAPVRLGSEHHESLLTKALQNQSDDDGGSAQRLKRRRSITSNFSLSSAADLTCDTGLTTPARTSSPSPRLSDVGFVPLVPHGGRVAVPLMASEAKTSSIAGSSQPTKDPAVQALEKKRCISFACVAKPKGDDKALMPPPPKPNNNAAQPTEAPKKLTIKFACPARVSDKASTPRQHESLAKTPVPRPPPIISVGQVRRSSSNNRSPRLTSSRKSSQPPALTGSKKWLTADSKDLQSEGSRFHEFASDEPQEDDWILHDDAAPRPKITVNDTLQKENAIRKLGKEAEEEAEEEDEDEDEDEDNDEEQQGDDEDDIGDNEEGDEDDEDEEDDDNDDNDENEIDDVDSKYDWNDEASDGYRTDNEVGFADSEEEDDGLVLWTAIGQGLQLVPGNSTLQRRPSASDHSDSSDSSQRMTRVKKRERRVPVRPSTPELPDSTDFVCGTLDEDRPLEEAYISHLAARKQGKLQLIPQDIDPSFPTSEPEDEAEELYKKGYGESDDHLWIHGELEDINQDRDRRSRKKKATNLSPKRMRSPPPKRLHSPPRKPRGRSPRRLLDQASPWRPRSPALTGIMSRSPQDSPMQLEEDIRFKSLAFRPGLTHTKSLPRGASLLAHVKTATRKSRTNMVTAKEGHVRGAIDIVKGLEQKRQRRKEKYNQKYCSRARKEKAQFKRPRPGQGAERMREVGLIMAGKIGQGNYVLSV